MPFPILLYILGTALLGGVVAVTLSVFNDRIINWVKSSFNYVITEIKVIVDRFWVGTKKVLKIKGITQKGNIVESIIEEQKINELPNDVREKINNGLKYEEVLTMVN